MPEGFRYFYWRREAIFRRFDNGEERIGKDAKRVNYIVRGALSEPRAGTA